MSDQLVPVMWRRPDREWNVWETTDENPILDQEMGTEWEPLYSQSSVDWLQAQYVDACEEILRWHKRFEGIE